MKITASHVSKIANLARLKLDQNQLDHFQKDLNTILDYMDLLREVDTTGIEPTVHTAPRGNALREDSAISSQTIADVLVNAPLHNGGAIIVPSVME